MNKWLEEGDVKNLLFRLQIPLQAANYVGLVTCISGPEDLHAFARMDKYTGVEGLLHAIQCGKDFLISLTKSSEYIDEGWSAFRGTKYEWLFSDEKFDSKNFVCSWG
jgi:hypothetical protein